MYIESPGYPNNYHDNLSCIVLFSGLELIFETLTFDDVQLSTTNSSCLEDYIVVETSDPSGGLNRTRLAMSFK